MSSPQQSQLTDAVVMVSPDYFRYNEETAEDNVFMSTPEALGLTPEQVPAKAMEQFRAMARLLRDHGITVLELPSRPDTPDAVFPNNWFSHHREGQLVLYPMLNDSRRRERQKDALLDLLRTVDVVNPEIVDLTYFEDDGPVHQRKALEGTGSLVLDRANHVAFAMHSRRTNPEVLDEWCRRMGYTSVFFHAYDKEKVPVYHTNVVMTVGDGFAVLCPESIAEASERVDLQRKLTALGKEVIEITLPQLYAYCGNILHLRSRAGEPIIVLSQKARQAFTPDQVRRLERHGKLVAADLSAIEGIGGGSARCMLAEVFHP